MAIMWSVSIHNYRLSRTAHLKHQETVNSSTSGSFINV